MDKFLAGILRTMVAVALVSFFAVLGGTIVFLLWPVAVPAAFPGLVASGVLAGKLSWWAAVCLTWLASFLWKSAVSAASKS